MINLSREIRFALVPPDRINDRKTANSWSGWPSTNLIVPHLVLRCVVQGVPDPQIGYLCNIKLIDDLLRKTVTSRLIPDGDGNQTAEDLVRTVYRHAREDWKSKTRIVSITLALSPYLAYTINSEESAMIQMTQQFEFSAAHRLHCQELSAEQNRELFGKCNNPEGHGHNYVVEVTVARNVDVREGNNKPIIVLEQFESIVKELVIDRLDHKHLNRDIEYFAEVNPSVENIAIALYTWLDGQFGPANLQKIRVYETPKTWAEFSGAP